MTIEEFQKNGELAAQWREVLAMPITKLVLGDVMKSDEPPRRTIRADITATYAQVRLGHIAGWSEYEQTLTEILLTTPKNTDQIEATFENPEPEPES